MTPSKLIAKLDTLPPTPPILPRLLALLRNPNADPSEIVGMIKLDPSLTVQVLRLSNSVYFATGMPSDDLEEAIGRIGYREAYKLVALVSGQGLLDHDVPTLSLESGQLWELSVSVAFLMEKLALELGGDPSTAYTIGLLHALGKLVLRAIEQDVYEHVYTLLEKNQYSLAEAEVEVLGFHSGQLAATLLRQWHFDDHIALPIQYQQNPEEAPRFRRLAEMLNLALWLAATLGQAHGRDAWAVNADPEAAKGLGLDEDRLQVLLVEATDWMEEVRSLLNVETTGSA